MQRRALAIRLKALGGDHPKTASSYSNLAYVLGSQGKYAEAEEMIRKALAVLTKVLGQDHPETATSYGGLASMLSAQKRYAEAEGFHRRELAIKLRALGQGHPETATSYNNLAGTLQEEENYTEAEAMYRRALAIKLKVLGENDPDTARTYHNLACVMDAQGKHVQAELMHRRALVTILRALGEGHPSTSRTYDKLAVCLDRQGRSEEALQTWKLAAASYEQLRLRGAKGLESAVTSDHSPLPDLALALARAGKPREAWACWEQGLARGVLDEAVGRAARPLSPDDRRKEADLLGKSQSLVERIGRITGRKKTTQEDEKHLEELRRQASDVRRQLLELQEQFDARYGILTGKPATIAEAQDAITAGTAVVGWIDTKYRHGACVLKTHGAPAWVLLPGKGEKGAWTKGEEELAGQLRKALDPETARSDWRPLAEALAQQRIEPIKKHLQGVKRLIVVNSPGMAGVPVEALLAATDLSDLVVSYSPSASMFTFLHGKRTTVEQPATLLALGDPAYPETKPEPAAPRPPEHGLLITTVTPNGNADLDGLKTGDVLTEYAGRPLQTRDDLKIVAAEREPRKIPVRYWRNGEWRSVDVAAGDLAVETDKRPPPQALAARREAETIVVGMRGGSWARLPGTRREVQAIAGLFPASGVHLILGNDARETTVQAMASAGKLRDYRFLHFATHGTTDPRHAYRSALILAPDPDRSADPLDPGLDSDGTITAEQIVRTWNLDADLVVLSACQSGLGRLAGGEGYLGFSQALFSKGAHSLVLSLWKVDDDATALLMTRFYQNLLGKRRGLLAPLPKAEALAEAKAWLRQATTGEVGRALAALPRGTIVHRQAVSPTRVEHPYDHPACWAGFVLVGSPN